jgi:hypothetical protein
MAVIDDRIENLDLGLFEHIDNEGQALVHDRQSMLALQAATRRDGPYTYLEIGSYHGGSLQPFVVDPLCTRIISIDPRVGSAADSRAALAGESVYDENTTEHMRELLDAIPGADLEKLTTIEASCEAIDPASVETQSALCFIDGEHTSQAALRDAIFCIQAAPEAAIVFHDRTAIRGALGAFVNVFGGYAYQLPTLLFVVERDRRLLDRSSTLRARVEHPRFWDLASRGGFAGHLMSGVATVKRAN